MISTLAGCLAGLPLAVCLGTVPGCHDDANIPEENPDCSWEVATLEAPDLQVGAPEIVVGQHDDDEFIPWSDGDTVEAVGGGQGLVMLLPVVKVVGAGDGMDAGDEHCLYVELTYAHPPKDDSEEGIPEDGGVAKAFVFTVDGTGDLVAGPLWAPFERSAIDDVFDVRTRVRANDFESLSEVRIHAIGG